jgi:hypothetical protein
MHDWQDDTGPYQHALLFVVEHVCELFCSLTHALVGLSANVKRRSADSHAPEKRAKLLAPQRVRRLAGLGLKKCP